MCIGVMRIQCTSSATRNFGSLNANYFMYLRIYVDLIDEGCTVKLENKDSLAFSNTPAICPGYKY